MNVVACAHLHLLEISNHMAKPVALKKVKAASKKPPAKWRVPARINRGPFGIDGIILELWDGRTGGLAPRWRWSHDGLGKLERDAAQKADLLKEGRRLLEVAIQQAGDAEFERPVHAEADWEQIATSSQRFRAALSSFLKALGREPITAGTGEA